MASVLGRDEPDADPGGLASELARLRHLAGVSGRRLAEQIGVSQSTVSRIESGLTIPALPEVTAWAEAVGASPQTRDRLIQLTEALHTQVHTWRAARRKQAHLQEIIEARETRAGLVRTFQHSLVPGLLQTADYARRVFGGAQIPYSEQDAAVALATRLRRQVALHREAKQFEFLITEDALRWPWGSAHLRAAQFDRIASLSTLENVSIGLIAQGAAVVTSVPHSFIIYYGYDGGPDTFVTVELVHAEVVASSRDDVRLYEERWNVLREAAIFGDEARRFLTNLRDAEA
jgi:transcriptional regulator with XRE-family HTH domain